MNMESNSVEMVKLQKELEEKEKEFMIQHELRIKALEESHWVFGSKEAR